MAWLDKAAKDVENRQAQAAELEYGKEFLALSIAASYTEIEDMKQVGSARISRQAHALVNPGTQSVTSPCQLAMMLQHVWAQEVELLQRAWAAVSGWQSAAQRSEEDSTAAAADGLQALQKASAEVLQDASDLGKSGDSAWPILKWLEVRILG